MKKYPEQLTDGRLLFEETFDVGALGQTEYTTEGVVQRSFRLVEGSVPTGTIGLLEGVAAKSNIINRNRRFYSQKVYELATGRAQGAIRSGGFLGEVDHPDYSGSLSGGAFRFTKLWMDGDLLKFEAVLLNTEPGKHLKGLLDGGVGVQISTRGYASSIIEKRKLAGVEVPIAVIGEDLHFEGIDAVLFASNPAGRVTSSTTESVVDANTHTEGQAMKTVAELRAAHPDLVAAIEASAREGFTPTADVDAKVAEATKAGETAGAQAALESDDVKALRATVAAVVESVKGHLPVAEKAVADQAESADKATIAALTAQVETLSTSVKTLTDERAAVQLAAEQAETERKADEAAATLKAAIVAKVDEVLKDSEYADLLRDKLLAVATVEAVQSTFETEQALIVKVAARAKVGEKTGEKGSGTADQREQNETDPATKEAATRLRRIAYGKTAPAA